MRCRRQQERGLAEIVGTLMLVVIVVAAATAFSFFVAAYEKQLQTNEALNHDRALEALRVVGISETTCDSLTTPQECTQPCAGAEPVECFAQMEFTIASLDVNSIEISSILLDRDPIVNFSVTATGADLSPCYDSANLTNATEGVGACSPVTLPGFGTVTIDLNLDEECTSMPPTCATETPGWYALFGVASPAVTSNSVLELQILTQLGNEFTESFTPPSAIASIFYVSSGSSSIPVLDGLDSFQPASANNASILLYSWSTSPDASPSCDGSGAELECSGLTSGTVYLITLEVTNSDGLSGFATIDFG